MFYCRHAQFVVALGWQEHSRIRQHPHATFALQHSSGGQLSATFTLFTVSTSFTLQHTPGNIQGQRSHCSIHLASSIHVGGIHHAAYIVQHTIVSIHIAAYTLQAAFTSQHTPCRQHSRCSIHLVSSIHKNTSTRRHVFFRVLARTSAFSRSPSARIALELLSNAPMEPASRAAVRVCSPFFFGSLEGGEPL